MTKPLVERYEQILAQDPASTAFVELAKALIARGDFARAIEVCQQGLTHHKDSVVGRVLWGKALIQLSRPAEAMEQFDQAIGIDRDNPHAYNLIGEVLLHKGLYRSALPILRKAVALQPNDGRVRQWMEQTQRALAGGPAPVVEDPTLPNELAPADDEPTLPLEAFPRKETATAIDVPAGPGAGSSADATGPSIAAAASAPGAPPPAPTPEPLADAPPPSAPDQPPPNELAPKTVPSFAALIDSTTAATSPDLQTTRTVETPLAERAKTVETPPAEQITAPLDQPPAEEPTLSPFAASPASPAGPGRRELLEDLAPPPTETAEALPIIAPRPPAQMQALGPPPGLARPPPIASSGSKRKLLTDIPEQAEPAATIELPKVELSPTAAQAIAQEYERELREKLAAEKTASQQRGFLARHGRMVAILSVVGVAAAVFVGVLLQTRAAHAGRDLKDALALARREIAQDTGSSYREALKALDVALQMAPGNADAWALTAYARAMLVAEHGGGAEERARAQAALAHSGVETGFPGLALVVRYHLAGGKDKDAAAKEVLASQLDAPEVQELAGRLLAARGDAEAARTRFKRAVDVPPGSVRALVGLADYYRAAGDCGHALEFYSAAGQLSPLHPERVVGAAECRLELAQDVEPSVGELEKISRDDDMPPDLMERRELVYGRALSVLGRHTDAITRLSDAAKGARTRAFDFDLALGEARRVAGDMEGAQGAIELALKLKPKSEGAREALGRILLARDREAQLLARLPAEPDARRVSLVRGMAYARQGDWRRARAELERTRVGDKLPSEAIIYMALADAAEDQVDHAQETLERVLANTRKAKSDVRVALGQLYWQRRSAPEKAIPLFTQAQEDPLDYEGACSLGRLLLSQGKLDEGIEALKKSLARNGSHGEARHALGWAWLRQEKEGEARKQFEAWQLDNPGSVAARRDYALVLHLEGRDKEAEAAINHAVKQGATDPETYRVQAEVLYARGDAKGAVAALVAAFKRDSKDPETICAMGRASLRKGKGSEAAKTFELVLQRDPHSACGRIGLALAKLPAGARGAVKELAELARSAEQPWDRTMARATRARALLAAGSVKDARQAAEEAVAKDPQSGDAQLALGLVAARQKDEPAAKAALEKAVDREPLYAAAHLALAELLARSDGELERAQREYEAFLKSGDDPAEKARVKRTLSTLKKKLATR